MSQKSSVPQAASFVSVVLKRDSLNILDRPALSLGRFPHSIALIIWITPSCWWRASACVRCAPRSRKFRFICRAPRGLGRSSAELRGRRNP